MEMKGKTIWRGIFILYMVACINIPVQAAYFACSDTLQNRIRLTKVVNRTSFSTGYRIASGSNVSPSNADYQDTSPVNVR